MSPAQYPSGRPDQFASSNSTANRFLGASRKPWMTDTASTLPKRPEHENVPSPNSKADLPRKPPSVFHREKPGPITVPGTTIQTSIQTQARVGNKYSTSNPIRAPDQDVVILSAQQFAPISPSTPGGTQPESASVPVGTIARNSIAFPSPQPSNASHPSPVAVAEGPRPAPAPKAGSQPVKNEGAIARVPSLSSSNRPAKPIPSPPSQPQSRSQSQPEPASSPSVSKHNWLWKMARDKLRSYLAASTKSRTLSENVELPRARILQDVCATKDIFYLALHQIFCLNSLSPSHLQPLSRYGIRPDAGFDVVAQLLVDNKRLSPDFVRWSAEYPLSLEKMLKVDEYTLALTQVSHCLTTIARNWSDFERDIRTRGHPPQVDELVVRLGVVSPVFQTIAFTAVSRRLLGPREELFKACMSLFEDDQRTYKQRSTSSASARHQWIHSYFERYRQLCALHGVQQQPDVNAHKDRALSSGQLPTTTSLNTSARPPQTQQTPPTNNSHLPPSNHQPNPHTVATYSQSSNRPPNHHTSPNMASNTGQRQQQQSSYYQDPMQAPRSGQRQQYAPPLQPPASFPPPPPHRIMTAQGSAPGVMTAPNQIPPPNFQPLQYPPHMRQGPDGIPVPMSAPGNFNMSPVHNLPYPTSFAMAQPPPQGGQGQRPAYSHPVSQPMPHPGIANVVPSMSMPMRPSPRHQHRQRVPSDPSAVQPNGTTPMALRHLLAPGFQQALPHQPPAQGATQSSVIDPSREVIQYFADFAIPVQKLPSNRSAFSWKFTVSRETLSKRSRLIPQANGRGHFPALSDGDVSYRLRCVRYQGQLDLRTVSAWSQAENHWPDVVYIHVNNTEIYRVQNSKQLPLPIDSHLKDGVNDIRLNILQTSEQRAKNITYAVAIEIIQVKSPENFRSMVKRLSAQESRQQIQNRLSLSNKNDDDLMIVDNFVSIDLRDPFTAQVFEVPVRGLLCTHKECFDLATFLQTLSTKPLAGKRAIYIRCPICRQDARPSFLVIDEFLVEVRAALSQQQTLETTKALRVKSDGSWEAVVELESDTKTASRKRDRASFEADLIKNEGSSEDTLSRTPAAPEIIELD
jgi:MIZ/SP-RING zinc finger